jgi:5'-3' exonuclease
LSSFVVIVDFSHLWHLCYQSALNAGPQYHLSDTIIYKAEGKLKTIQKVLQKQYSIAGYDLIFAEDRPATRKLCLHPNYRKGRVNHAEAKNQLKSHLISAGYVNRFCSSEGNEADDVIATLVKLAETPKLFTVVVTGDRDLWQLIGPTTSVFNPIKKEIVTPAQVYEAFSVIPNQVALVKALWGDAGDCVPNALPRTQKYLYPILRQVSTGELSDFWDLLILKENWDGLTLRCREIVQEGKPQANLNWELVKLDDQCQLAWD